MFCRIGTSLKIAKVGADLGLRYSCLPGTFDLSEVLKSKIKSSS